MTGDHKQMPPLPVKDDSSLSTPAGPSEQLNAIIGDRILHTSMESSTYLFPDYFAIL